MIHLTEDEAGDLLPGHKVKRRTKYGNIHIQADNFTFDSKAEYERYLELKQWQAEGKIIKLSVHPVYTFILGGVKIGTYEADFQYWKAVFDFDKPTYDLYPTVEDVKSPPTAKLEAFRMKKAMMKCFHGIDVQVILT